MIGRVMSGINPMTVALVVASPIAAWRLHARLRFSEARRRVDLPRAWGPLLLLPALVLVLALLAADQPGVLAGLASGLAAGGVLALVALRTTIFAATPAGLFYTPNRYFGALLAVLLLGRFVYRATELYAVEAVQLAVSAPARLLSPLTLATVGMVAGYYAAYAAGLLRRSYRARRDCAAGTPGGAAGSSS